MGRKNTCHPFAMAIPAGSHHHLVAIVGDDEGMAEEMPKVPSGVIGLGSAMMIIPGLSTMSISTPLTCSHSRAGCR
jgi:hypothetical protein